MSATKRIISIALSVIALLSVCCIGVVSLSVIDSQKSSDTFAENFKSIITEYDSSIDYDDVKRAEELKRIIISDYNGNDYSCVAKAVDTQSGIAILQYDSEADVKKAYSEAVADGRTVDYDNICELPPVKEEKLLSDDNLKIYNKGEMSPTASNAIGTKSFLDKYAIQSDEVTVAVIDTGVMYDHPQLEGRFISGGYDLTSDGCDDAYYDTECSGDLYEHATIVCGIIANNTPDNVKILPYKVVPFGSKKTSVSIMVSTINAAVRSGAKVINLSMVSDSGESAFTTAVQNCINHNVCLCTSTGNEGSQTLGYPASIDGAIAVSALNSRCDGIASFSNYGSCVDFAAPGTKINSSIPTPDGPSYDCYSGTSFATPHISALCADFFSMCNEQTYSQVYNMLMDYSVDFGDVGFDEHYGYGVPSIANLSFTDDDNNYTLNMPEGDLYIHNSVDYTRETVPWAMYNTKILNAYLDDDESEVGAYTFYNLCNAEISISQPLTSVGDYAFFDCAHFDSVTLSADVSYIGADAFTGVFDNFNINGYRNTIAESYANSNGISFNALGCAHTFLIDVTEPADGKAGYTKYTCFVCGEEYIGDYIETTVIQQGSCGDGVSFTLKNTGLLTISGDGEMYPYINSEAPWYENRGSIKVVQIGDNVRSVSPYAFYNCGGIYEFRCNSNYYISNDRSLYSADMSRLICAVNGESGAYVMPNLDYYFDARAFLVNPNISIITNDDYYVDMSILYNQSGDIIFALTSYKSQLLYVNNDIFVSEYAFILSEYPENIRVNSYNVRLGDYSVGYHYDNGYIKDSLTYYGYVESPAYQYAVDNDFDIDLMNSGECGDDVTWRYNVDTNTLILYGTGRMHKYTARADVPWYTYISQIKTVVVSNDITYISPYSFYGATSLESLTMPLSLEAPSSQTVWYNAKNIKNITLTIGNGSMKDYGTSNNSVIYRYTPWYFSASSLESLSIDNNVRYIGAYAFRGCNAITSLVFNCCDSIGKYAFYDCRNLTSVVNYSKGTLYSSNAMFTYSFEQDVIPSISGYDDSTTRDYSQKVECGFLSLGCEHSRGMRSEGERPVCCYDSEVSYYCVDCSQHFYDEYLIAQGNGHYVKSNVVTTNNKPICNAEVYKNGKLSAITNANGFFVLDEVLCEQPCNIVICKDGLTLCDISVDTASSNRYGNIRIKYGNFVKDGYINVQDYAYARKHGFTDLGILDYGKVSGEEKTIKKAYGNQALPGVTNSYIEPSPTEPDGIYEFYFEERIPYEFTVTEVGFLYGKNMSESDLVVDNIGKNNASGYAVKQKIVSVYPTTKMLNYGSLGKTGTVSARLYIKYTNGVKDYISYSDVLSHTY